MKRYHSFQKSKGGSEVWDFLKEKAPEILVIIVILGGGGWLFPKVQDIEYIHF